MNTDTNTNGAAKIEAPRREPGREEHPQRVPVLALHFAAQYGLLESEDTTSAPAPSARIAGILAAAVQHGGDSAVVVDHAFRSGVLGTLRRVRDGSGDLDAEAARSDLLLVLATMDEVTCAETPDEGREIAREYFAPEDHPVAARAFDAVVMVRLNAKVPGGAWPAWQALYPALARFGELLDFMGEDAAILERFAVDFMERLSLERLSV